ncbi:MAG: hypothetical protein HOJ22_04285 [Chloroflexi bacterium]|nr:hypothetical protein [Chloroflexota bacterium]MBT5627489.1 hypothetical protein [Chloroflexota bacterium]
MRIIGSWSGTVCVVLLFAGLLYDSSEIAALPKLLLGLAAVAYGICWYNFASVVDKFKGLSLRQGLVVSTVGVVSTALAVANVGVFGPVGWFVLGVAMLGVAFGILKARLLPDGFAWLSGILGIITSAAGVTGDTSDIGTGAVYVLLVWIISMSILFIGWGRYREPVSVSSASGRR